MTRRIWIAMLGLALQMLSRQAAAQADVGTGALSAQLAQGSFSRMAPGAVAPPWQLVGLPGQKQPMTGFDITLADDGTTALRVRADGSYGNLLFDAHGAQLASATRLRWRWRLEQGLDKSDLRRKDGDDVPLKVCALFDMALGGMSFGEQTRLRMARALSGQPLPAATLCYVWDRTLPLGSIVRNAFSARVRYLVVGTGPARPGQWMTIERPVAEDFLRAFGDETRVLPPLIALGVGADADNTGGSSLGLVGDLVLVPAP
jgi:Protein of unknown function (DUF3047)